MSTTDPSSLVFAALLHGDLLRCMEGLDLLGASFAAAHLSAAIEALKSESGLPQEPRKIRMLANVDLSPFEGEIANLVREWERRSHLT